MLHCYWPKHLIGTEHVTNQGFDMGVFLMATGMGEISDKTIEELRFRGALKAALHHDDFYKNVDLELWKGLSINGRNLSRRAWLSALRKGQVSDAHWKCKDGTPHKDRVAAGRKAEARFKLLVAQVEAELCEAV